jgi:integrase
VEAIHALAYIKTFFNWCVPRYLKHSPCTGLRPSTRHTPRERLLTNDELAAIWRTADTMGDYGRHVQLLITTGQRCNQILSLNDDWISDNSITFPAPSMKNNRTHIIPLGKLTAALLEGRGHLTRFPDQLKKELDRRSGVSGWTLHDIRRALASGMASLGIRLPVIERLLAHRSGSFAGIVGVYQHYDFLPEARSAIELWESHILKITGQSP